MGVRPAATVEDVNMEERPGVLVGTEDRSADVPTVYVVALSRWGSGPSADWGGVSVSAEHGALFSHVSSSLGFLELDTTTLFADRAERFRELFPAGFRRVTIDRTKDEPDPMPEEIAHHFVTLCGESLEAGVACRLDRGHEGDHSEWRPEPAE